MGVRKRVLGPAQTQEAGECGLMAKTLDAPTKARNPAASVQVSR